MVGKSQLLFAIGTNAFSQKFPWSQQPSQAAVSTKSGKWLPWGAWAECRGVCGSGVQTRVRRCLGGVAGVDCSGNTLDSRACNNPVDDTCSYWSGWGQWSAPSSSCGTAQRCKSRTCYGRNTDHCHGPTQLCEAIENPVPETKTICNPPTETCCPAGQPDCCVKQCYTTNACATERTILPPTSCDTQLPCCDEWSPFGPWSSPTVSCFEASVSRQRYNLCNKEQVQNEVKQIELGDGNFADWTLSQGCSGEVLSSGHQCPGSLQYSRDHSCYTAGIHTRTRTGDALDFTRVEACGSLAPTVITDWDKTDAQCAQICLNRNVFRTRKEIQPCTGAVVNEEVEPCGVAGSFGPFSDWTESDATCGGNQWRWQIHSCDIDTATGRPKVNYERRDAINSGPKVGEDTWGAFGPWSDTCADSYPAACADGIRTRTRNSVCGVRDSVTGVVQYEQVETARCPKPALPAPVVTIGECSASCVDESTPESYKIKTTSQVCVQDIVESLPCDVPSCCKWIDEPNWSPCDCTGTQFYYRTNTCSYIEAVKITRECMKPTEPYQEVSEWSACSSSCPSLGFQTRFACPRCELNESTCLGARRETRKCPGENPRRPVELACIASCGQEGAKTVYEEDICTGIKYNERQVPCSLPIGPQPDWEAWGECVHDRANKNCPGQQVRRLPAWIDSNTKQICAAEDYEVRSCGPAKEPDNIVEPWSQCTATAQCVQTQRTYNLCTGYDNTESRSCDLGWTDYSMWTQCQPITLSYDRQHICTGTRSRSRKNICGRMPDEFESVSCGIETQLATEVDLTEATFFSSVYHYYDCERDALSQPKWSACSATCDGPDATGMGFQTISRRSICPNKWKDITISKPCSIVCEDKCQPPVWDAWTGCSSDCELGYQTRTQYQMCVNFKTKEPYRTDLQTESRQCGAPRKDAISYTACTSANKCAAPGVFCGQGSRQRIVTAISQVAGCPVEKQQIEQSRIDEACELPACPVWGPFQGEMCSMCATSRTLFRTCQKAVGAESCECAAGDSTKVETCMPSVAFGAWSDYSTCSVTCGTGLQYRTRAKVCNAEQKESESRVCQMDPGRWVVIVNNGFGANFVEMTADAGWSACSSVECVAGYQERTLRHTCTGETKVERKQCLPAQFPDGGDFTAWTQVSGCSVSCGVGYTTWTRSHVCKKYNNIADETAQRPCEGAKAVAGIFSDWSACPRCSNSIVYQSRSRQWSCAGYGTPFAQNNGLESETRACAIPNCARWGPWRYTPCSCSRRDTGFRERECIGGDAALGITCDGPAKELIPCNDQKVIPTGVAGMTVFDRSVVQQPGSSFTLVGWRLETAAPSAWSGCKLTCSPTGQCGSETRTISTFCVDEAGRYPESSRQETRVCPCGLPESTGIEWQGCTAPEATCPGMETGLERFTCGGQTKTHSRPCGVSGTWGAWSQFSGCNKNCGGGVMTRSRSWTCKADLKPDQIETATCNQTPCSYYGAWSNWSACSVSCGIGSMTRTRYCHGGEDGTGLCVKGEKGVGKLEQATCDMGQCCEWAWSGWTSCCYSSEEQKNIRLRVKGNKCSDESWEFKQKQCEVSPVANPANPQFINCRTIIEHSQASISSGQSAKFYNFVNPDQIKTEVIKGPVLGYKDQTATAFSFKPSKSNFYIPQNQVPYNSPPVLSQTTVSAMPAAAVPLAPPAAVSSKALMAAQTAQMTIKTDPAPVKAAPVMAPTTPNRTNNNMFGWMWNNPWKVNSNSNTHAVTGN